MRRLQLALFGGMMLGLGYFCGASGLPTGSLSAQDRQSVAGGRIKAALLALNEAADALKADGQYETITEGPNAFLILSGGGSARQDLESGGGVDPETFAALYAGKALPEIQDQIARDDQGRLTFNGNVIQMYSRTTLERRYAERLRLSGAR
ncbi:MAG: hypothetical protein KF774_21290 [Planctomyces sp.]|nr:hypothetical protein [Planctomyces sp.]